MLCSSAVKLRKPVSGGTTTELKYLRSCAEVEYGQNHGNHRCSEAVQADETQLTATNRWRRRRRRQRQQQPWRCHHPCSWETPNALLDLHRYYINFTARDNAGFATYFVILLLILTLLSLFFVVGTTVLWTFRHLQCFYREAGVVWSEGASHDTYRPCPSVSYKTLSSLPEFTAKHFNICITTLTEKKKQNSLLQWTTLATTCRYFDAVHQLTWPNRKAFAEKHGYHLVDGSALVDPSRPPAWSKIKAVQSLLYNNNHTDDARNQHNCDWIFWMDADTVIVNASIRIESFLPASPNIDLLVTYDRRFTANSGAWLIRAQSDWAQAFLQEWWNMKHWVRERGLSLSGDNAAFGHLLDQKLASPIDKTHIRMVPRCTFNSFGWFIPNNVTDVSEEETLSHLHSPNFYHKGDFVGHASGIDQKEAGVRMFLQRAAEAKGKT